MFLLTYMLFDLRFWVVMWGVGDTVGACRENERWNRGTVRGVSVVLPGLKIRADANSDLCTNGL